MFLHCNVIRSCRPLRTEETKEHFEKKSKVYESLMSIKQRRFIKAFQKKEKQKEEKKRRSLVSMFSLIFS